MVATMEALKRSVGTIHARQSEEAPTFDRGDISFIIICAALVLFMVPGLGFLYSGLSRRKNALALLWVCVFSNAVIIFQWYFWGYSLAFSTTATNGFIGNLRHFGMQHVLADPSPGSPLIPDLLYSFYQLEFCCVTVAILMGASVVVSCQQWSLHFCGPHSFIAQSHAGAGTSMDGGLSGAFLTMLVEVLSKSALVSVVWHSPGCLVAANKASS
ncbi:Ammonium transporter MEP3 [Rhizoctonia solani AG-1 IB]|uniref:Ammonium transporter MEP3 n=1 Tax=Thanatephorus cucumeris (strain AG1-IB / isolate 7/3/14) TaxID=1108050 RepID=M5BT15_THACB|nr:Ammonium transporter MEP3 [Rhizoctonia solani AG-1 IB]